MESPSHRNKKKVMISMKPSLEVTLLEDSTVDLEQKLENQKNREILKQKKINADLFSQDFPNFQDILRNE